MSDFALFAGSSAAAIFMISQLPMLIKACRTKNLTSYSLANIGLANLGNVLYAVYVLQVPLGPVWAVHGFNLTASGLMLAMYLRYGRRAGQGIRRGSSAVLTAADQRPSSPRSWSRGF
ncbi:MAG TPA: PQ-loop repeat-containing protein [Microlunatus sp.]